MLLDGLGWSHYSVFAPCIMTQTRVLGRSGGGVIKKENSYLSHRSHRGCTVNQKHKTQQQLQPRKGDGKHRLHSRQSRYPDGRH